MLDQSKANQSLFALLCISFMLTYLPTVHSQGDTIVIGFGEFQPNQITASSQDQPAENTMNQDGYLPNLNAASRFLSQASLGYDINDIQNVANMGIEDWIDDQFNKPKSFHMIRKVEEYHDYRRDSLMDPNTGQSIRFFDYAWWQYHMQGDDYLRQRVAFALTEILVISRFSNFGNNSYPFAYYYDMLLDNAFGNYRDILQEVTYHPSMGRYLTYLNNPKEDPSINQFPDENYARELMQLFTIGLFELNPDGTQILDNNNEPIPTYDNDDIYEFSKIFTGLSWGDRTSFGKSNPQADSSYVMHMIMFNDHHQDGEKYLLNGDTIMNRMPVDGDADISDALDNLFNHQNIAPFISRLLIQRLVTSNPSPAYISRVSSAFNDNGSGVKGDMKSIIKAILLDPEAKSCGSSNDTNFGMLREPFIRYVQINKAFQAYTPSGNFRNDMDYIFRYTQQKPFTSPSVFNFFQPDYTPIGPIEEAGKVAPEFQIANSQTITGFINGSDRWVIDDNPADEYSLFSGESSSTINMDRSFLQTANEEMYTDDNQLHILMDRLNLILAQGRVSDISLDMISQVLLDYPAEDQEDREDRVRLAAYLLLSSPEYLINR